MKGGNGKWPGISAFIRHSPTGPIVRMKPVVKLAVGSLMKSIERYTTPVWRGFNLDVLYLYIIHVRKPPYLKLCRRDDLRLAGRGTRP